MVDVYITVEKNMAMPVTYYTLKEVNEHRERDSCWITIDGKVYDVTKYLDQHPGGDQEILNEAGSNATEAFVGHSADAKEILETLTIGFLHPDDIKLLAKKENPAGWSKIVVSAAVAAPVLAVAIIAVIIFSKRK